MNKYASYILYLLISVFVVILFINDFGPMTGLQQSLNDALLSFNAPKGVRPNVVIVNIDGKAMDQFGQWPWNRDLIADLMAAVAHGEPKVIVPMIDLSEDASQDSAGYTTILSSQLAWIKNAVLPYDIAITTFRSSLTNNPEYLFDYSLVVDNPLGLMKEDASLQVRKVFLPAEKVLKNKPYLGFDFIMPSDDRVLRYQPLLMNFEGYYYPSLELMASAVFLGVEVQDIKIVEGSQIELANKRTIPVNDKSEMLISFPNGRPYVMYSAADILGEDFSFERLKGKVVIIGTEDPSMLELFDTPVGETKTRLVAKAGIIENIINDDLIKVAEHDTLLNILILFILGGICALVLPQVSTMYRFVILLVGFVILANVNYFMLTSFNTLSQTVYIGLELFLFMIASPFADSALLTGQKSDTASKKKVPAAKVSATDIDKAPVREIKSGSDTSASQPTEAVTVDGGEVKPVQQATVDSFADHQAIRLDDSGGMDKAAAASSDSGNVDTSMVAAAWQDSEIPKARKPSDKKPADSGPVDSAIVGGNDSGGFSSSSDGFGVDPYGDSNAGAIIDPTGSGPMAKDSGRTPYTEITQLGRYKVTGTLGRGAMGQVYRGVDPAINRPVALKTIRLDFVNDPQEMEELRERLHREAQAAGKLSHPNIVTIYDVGSEGHLQYIAMEYLEGQTLEEMIKKKTNFNFKIIAKIIIQICSALEYAHERGIVHRDIKPANIMILRDYSVKVMDFGIARVDSHSMTKTGIAMGTPNYISPEQLQGLPVDQRADLFSLGVVMYELLIGKRPFKGENITSLIYAILNHEPQKPSEADQNIPPIFDHIITKALKKNPSERYQKSAEITTDLFDFVESFASR